MTDTTPTIQQNKVIVFDTTLRDGEQSPGATMHLREKIDLAHQLSRLGVDVIEAGFAIASPGDFEAIKTVSDEVQGPVICSLARAMEADIVRAGEALASAKRKRIHTFIATSPVHLTKKLMKTQAEVVQIAYDAVKLACTFTDDVEFSCEDASRSDLDYLVEVINAAIEAGARTINLPDTVGYTMPWQYEQYFEYLRAKIKNPQGIILSAHCHNDLGLAVANTLAAVRAGARQIECTVNGIGERAGNCSLEEVVMALQTRKDFFGLTTGIVSRELCRTSRLVTHITGLRVQRNKAIVGANAFAHEAGIHQDGVLKARDTYEIMRSEDVGWTGDSMVLGKHSGRHAVKACLQELGWSNLQDAIVDKIFARFKALCDKKKEIFNDDLEALAQDELGLDGMPFVLEHISFYGGDHAIPTASVHMTTPDGSVSDSAVGNGPVDAVFQTLQRITNIAVTLDEYSIEAITGGTDALGFVSVSVNADNRKWRGRAADTDIIIASAKAFVNAINKIKKARDFAAQDADSK
ncbi:2-isopropylmalate synthase [Candidatus Sumerlaeota bacterium]|nr:2-isopropylmalate synthase [Candidatus Sumerlaeales bacterium]NLD61738.1 2-isopropylmalate synthase [Candidatus Sumerlaeota bacterium]